MSKTLLEQLREMTTVVADSGDFRSVLKFRPQDSTTNPSLIAAAAQMPAYRSLVDDVLRGAKSQLGGRATDQAIANLAFRQLAVAFGKEILEVIPGRVSTEEARDCGLTKRQSCLRLVTSFSNMIRREFLGNRVLIKIASTWEGIEAARQLEQENIRYNLTLLFGIHQAVACAEGNITLISPFVGRIPDLV
jgi:transaldolase